MANESGSGAAWFLVGAALGAGLGVLFAPRSGEETREALGEWLRERREQGSEFLEKMKEKIPEKKEKIVNAYRAGRHAYEESGAKS